MTHFSTLHGCYTALLTPFGAKGVDYGALEHFVDWQVTEGVHGLVPCGTTGETATLSSEEYQEVIARTVKIAAGRVKVMAGTGSNSTEKTIASTRLAETLGADAALVVAPYYNKPTQEGIYQHFKAVAASSGLPIIVYNIPGRSGVNITDETLARLAELPTIAGVKDATGDLARVPSLRHLVGDRLTLFSGEDMTTVGFNAMGGNGVISVISNIVPKLAAEVQNLTAAQDYIGATKLQDRLVPLVHAMFCETSPGPVKYAASLLGKSTAELRLPLVETAPSTQEAVRAAMAGLQLL